MKEIFERVSLRKYTDEDVTPDQIEAILRAGMAAPSAGNQQPWEFYVTRNADIKNTIAENIPTSRHAAGANVIIVPCTRVNELKHAGMAPQDMGACLENMLLTVTELGLGAVWCGIEPERDRMDFVAKTIGAKEGHDPFAVLCIGHPDDDRAPTGADRYDESRIHWVE